MAKKIVLGNKNMSLSYDSNLSIKDIYYPYIGDENHLEEDKNRVGFWVSGKFSWIDEEWKKNIKYSENSLVTQIKTKTEYLNIELKEKATIHFDKNIYLRVLAVKNLSDEEKEIKLFFHHILKLYGKNKNNTALYDPISKSVIHYKKHRYFLFNGLSESDSLYEYRVSNMEIGTEGAYKDAEDGKLEINEIAQGKVNSMFSLREKIGANEKKVFYYWFCAGESFQKVRQLNELVLKEGVDKLIEETKTYWKSWLSKRNLNFGKLKSNIIDQYNKSLIMLKSHINENGSIITSVDFEHCEFNKDTYNYVNFRDASLVVMALDSAGYTEIARNFFRFAKKISGKGGYFWQKYYPDGSVASMWHSWYVNKQYQLPIQEDQTALMLIALSKHYEVSKDIQFIEEIYKKLIKKPCSFLCDYIDENNGIIFSSYNIWGDMEGHHFYTTAAVYEALALSQKFVKMFGSKSLIKKIYMSLKILKKNIIKNFWDESEQRFLRTIKFDYNGEKIGDYKYDSSVMYTVLFENFYEEFQEKINWTIEKTIEKLRIKTKIGGIARYEGDNFHQFTKDIKKVTGNPWFTATLLAANYYINIGKLEIAMAYIEKVEKWSLKSGILAEQVHPYSGEPVSVGPYIPSHALYILVLNRYLKKTNINII